MMSLLGVAYVCTIVKKWSPKKVFKLIPLVFDFSGNILHISADGMIIFLMFITPLKSQDFKVLTSRKTNNKGSRKDSKIPASFPRVGLFPTVEGPQMQKLSLIFNLQHLCYEKQLSRFV